MQAFLIEWVLIAVQTFGFWHPFFTSDLEILVLEERTPRQKSVETSDQIVRIAIPDMRERGFDLRQRAEEPSCFGVGLAPVSGETTVCGGPILIDPRVYVIAINLGKRLKFVPI